MFGLARAGRKFGRRKYSKDFNRSSNIHVHVGSFKRTEEEDFGTQDPKEPVIKLPSGWTTLASRDDDDEVHFVRMTMSTEYCKNIIPSSKWDSTGKRINSQLATFSVANRNGTEAAKINFSGEFNALIRAPEFSEIFI